MAGSCVAGRGKKQEWGQSKACELKMDVLFTFRVSRLRPGRKIDRIEESGGMLLKVLVNDGGLAPCAGVYEYPSSPGLQPVPSSPIKGGA